MGAAAFSFTFAPEATVRPGFAGRVRRLVEAEGGRVCFVRLHVSAEEQERRIGLPSLSEFHKLTSPETLPRLRNNGLDVEQPPADLDIDTDRSAPAHAAGSIAAHFSLRQQPVSDRYPSRGDAR